MFCPNCGKEIEEESTFCCFCGMQVEPDNDYQEDPMGYNCGGEGDGFSPAGGLKGSMSSAGGSAAGNDYYNGYSSEYYNTNSGASGYGVNNGYDDNSGYHYNYDHGGYNTAGKKERRFFHRKNKGSMRRSRKIMIGAGGILVIAIIVVAVILITRTPAYERPIVAIQTIMNTRKISKATDAVVEIIPIKLFEDINVDVSMYTIYGDEEEIRDYYEDVLEDLWYELEDEFGDDAKMTYEVKSAKDLKNSELKDLREQYEDKLGVDGDLIEDAMNLVVKLKMEGSDDRDTERTNFKVVKVDGKWYIDIFSLQF